MRDEVVLYSPHFVGPAERAGVRYRGTPPLSHLALAGPLQQAGYRVSIVDAKWDHDWRDAVRERIDHIACFGVTSLTGPSVSEGLEAAAYVKTLRADVPVIWGGWHSTFAAAQAVDDPRVDVVVRSMGERTLVELLAALASGGSLREIAGITFREDNDIIATPDRPPEDVNHFPPPAYELIRPERYIYSGGGAYVASTIFSRGCPYDCDFCLDSRTKWLGLSLERMIADIEYWIAHGANHVCFYDGNFFLGKPRLVAFSKALLDRGLESRFRWMATAVGHRVAQMDDELLGLLKRAGLSQIALGAESGSDELLRRITNKTTVESTLEAIRRLTRHGINQYLFFLIGYPDEPADALERTFELALKAKEINPRVEMNFNFTTPLPGSEVFRIAVERGYVRAPRAFEDWAAFDYTRPNLLPIDAAYVQTVRRFLRFFSMAFGEVAEAQLSAMLRQPLRRMAKWRLENKYYDYPVELSLIDSFHSVRHTLQS